MADIVITLLGLLATAFTIASTLPQIKKALKTKDTGDVSIRFLIVLIVGLYGLYMGSEEEILL